MVLTFTLLPRLVSAPGVARHLSSHTAIIVHAGAAAAVRCRPLAHSTWSDRGRCR